MELMVAMAESTVAVSTLTEASPEVKAVWKEEAAIDSALGLAEVSTVLEVLLLPMLRSGF